MIRIAAEPIKDIVSLRAAVQNAIRLELFTIPPYLTAHHTLARSGGAGYAKRVIQEIVRAEMLHLNLACNVLNAIGGAPAINDDKTIPSYPKPLPMAIAGGVVVHLKRYSHDLVKSVFMAIEAPEHPIDLPIKSRQLANLSGPTTIGEFYRTIREEICRQGSAIFTGDPGRQVTGIFVRPGEDIKVVDPSSATLAIDTIVEQGEGTPTGPSDLQNHIAHFYRFQELDKGMKIVADLQSPVRFSFDPKQPVSIDDVSDVITMVDDPQTITLDASDTEVAQLADACDVKYSEILNTMQEGYNGSPDKLGFIDATMREFGGMVDELLKLDLHGKYSGLHAGPRFKYVPTTRMS